MRVRLARGSGNTSGGTSRITACLVVAVARGRRPATTCNAAAWAFLQCGATVTVHDGLLQTKQVSLSLLQYDDRNVHLRRIMARLFMIARSSSGKRSRLVQGWRGRQTYRRARALLSACVTRPNVEERTSVQQEE